MRVVSFTSHGKRVDIPIEVLKTWTEAAWQASADARHRNLRNAKEKLSPGQFKDYIQHRRAGTPHEFAMGLAER